MLPALQFLQVLLKILDLWRLFTPGWLNDMAFFNQMFGLQSSAARELLIQAAVCFNDTPEWSNSRFPILQILLCRLRDNPEENSGAEWSGKVSLKILRQPFSYPAIGNKSALFNPANHAIDVERSGDKHLTSPLRVIHHFTFLFFFQLRPPGCTGFHPPTSQ
jgi:hypothetical protein